MAIYFKNYSYDDALIGYTTDDRAVYDYDKMVDWLMRYEDWTREEAIEWIEYNTIRSLDYMGDDGPVVVYGLASEFVEVAQ